MRSLTVLNEANGQSIALNLPASTTLGAVKAMIEALKGIPAAQQRLHYNGRQAGDEAKVGAKTSLIMKLEFTKGIADCVDEADLNRFTQVELFAYADQLGLEVSRTAAKTTILKAVLNSISGITASGSSIIHIQEENDMLKERIRILEAQVEKQANKQTKSYHKPKANTNHQATEDSASTAWWTSEEAAESQAQFKTDKQ